MSLSRSLLAAVVGLGLLQSACIGSSDDLQASALDAPRSEKLDGPGGTGGVNGLSSRKLEGHTPMLIDATMAAISTDFPDISDELIKTGILNTGDGQQVFSYAAKCSIPDGTTVSLAGFGTYTGLGMLSTSNWLSSSLSDSGREDLFACMIAHVNPYGLSIPIVLTGEHITDNDVDYSDFTIREALWTATYDDTSNTITYDVWPHPALADYCTDESEDFFDERVCDQGVGCNVQVHDDPQDIENDCSQDAITGHYTCDGRPAIMTWLTEDGAADLHPECIAPG